MPTRLCAGNEANKSPISQSGSPETDGWSVFRDVSHTSILVTDERRVSGLKKNTDMPTTMRGTKGRVAVFLGAIFAECFTVSRGVRT